MTSTLIENIEKYKEENKMVNLARKGDREATSYIFEKYKRVVKSIASNYFFMGSDHNDVFQEGMFGLYKAIRDFNPEKSVSFGQFARLCISRQIMASAKKASGSKHMPLNYYVSLDKSIYDKEDNSKQVIDIISSNNLYEPSREVIYNEMSRTLKRIIKEKLSSFERTVVALHLESKSYQKIAGALKCKVKSVDNALQRARKKIRTVTAD